MRNAMIVEVQPDQLGNLSFLAGMLVGLGRPEAEVLKQILDSLILVEVDDDFGKEPIAAEETPEDPEGDVIDLFPVDETLPNGDDIDFERQNPGVEMAAATPEEARAFNTTPSGFPMDVGVGPTPDVLD